jgi:hypothetical protein
MGSEESKPSSAWGTIRKRAWRRRQNLTKYNRFPAAIRVVTDKVALSGMHSLCVSILPALKTCIEALPGGSEVFLFKRLYVPKRYGLSYLRNLVNMSIKQIINIIYFKGKLVFTLWQWYYDKTQRANNTLHTIPNHTQTKHNTKGYTNNKGHILICLILPAALWPWGSQPVKEMRTRNLPAGKARPALKAVKAAKAIG